jgi:mxaJ protein
VKRRAAWTIVAAMGALGIAGLARTAHAVAPVRPLPALRVCADPNNLPYSNWREEGFENRLAVMAARDLGRSVQYDWSAQRRGYLRNTLNADACDVLMGVPTRLARVATTRPYYRSTYVFVERHARRLGISSLDDPRLRQLKIGVQLIGDDFRNSPPAHALSRRGIVRNVVGYTVYGDYRRPTPPADIVRAVARGTVDAALVWGPLAGYFAKNEATPLDVMPVSPRSDGPALPFVFDISIGVRHGDEALRQRLDAFVARHQQEITALLGEYGVPVVN